MNRLAMMKTHVILAAFFFPLLLMFLGTGLLYTLGQKGQTHSEKQVFESQQFDPEDINLLSTQLKPHLPHHFYELLSHAPNSIKKQAQETTITWASPKQTVIFESDAISAKQSVERKEKNTLAWLMKLHKAGGYIYLKIATVLLVASLVLVFLSGLYLGLTIPRLRKLTSITLLLGIGHLIWLLLIH